MAKKVRRVRRSRARSNAEQTAAQPENETKRRDAAERFRQEYAYVLKDLRHILLLAVAMFILLVALNLILR